VRSGPPSERTSAADAAPAMNRAPAAASNRRKEHARQAEEDRALVARAKAGDKSAFRALVERHQRKAFAIAVALVRDENDAREIVQDAFVRVFKSLNDFEGNASFYTWLYRIVTNLGIDLMRKPGRRGTSLEEVQLDGDDESPVDGTFLGRLPGADPAEIVKRREIGARLQSALDGLPSYHRAVVVMREIDGLSYDEMAQAMGVSKGTIMSRLFHARQKLQRALADCYVEYVGGRPGGGTPPDGTGS